MNRLILTLAAVIAVALLALPRPAEAGGGILGLRRNNVQVNRVRIVQPAPIVIHQRFVAPAIVAQPLVVAAPIVATPAVALSSCGQPLIVGQVHAQAQRLSGSACFYAK